MTAVKSINEPNTPTLPGLLGGSINEPVRIPEGAGTPVITNFEPGKATIGQPDFTLFLTGSGFIAQSVIVFAGHDEPTTLNEDGTLSTGVNMSVWLGPDTVPISVRNGPLMSNTVNFTFQPEGTAVAEASDPDDLEDEIDEAEDEGDFQSTHPTHRGRPTTTRSSKRSKASKEK